MCSFLIANLQSVDRCVYHADDHKHNFPPKKKTDFYGNSAVFLHDVSSSEPQTFTTPEDCKINFHLKVQHITALQEGYSRHKEILHSYSRSSTPQPIISPSLQARYCLTDRTDLSQSEAEQIWIQVCSLKASSTRRTPLAHIYEQTQIWVAL